MEVVDVLLEYLKEFKKVVVDEKFKASSDANISRYIHEMTGISCVQIEISEDIRFNHTENIVNCFENMIKKMK
jgi:hypothetical protein